MEHFTEKQQGMVTKVASLRNKISNASRNNANSANTDQLYHTLQMEEERLRTSLKSSKGWRKYHREGKEGDESSSEDEDAANRLVDSADESDEFFDRTKQQPQPTQGKVISGCQEGAPTQSYAQLKAQMQELC